MRSEPNCPRCGGVLRAPGLWTSDWQCDWHGAVLPFVAFPRIGPEIVEQVATRSQVPVWLPLPAPLGWVISGTGYVGDERTGARASVLALSGPAPLGGGGELVFVAEEPGIGLGASYAGLSEPDPGDGFDAAPPHAKVEVVGHPTPLWALPTGDDCAAYVGEAKGLWLWVVLWPASAGVLMLESLALTDLRDRLPVLRELPYGALCPRLSPPRRH